MIRPATEIVGCTMPYEPGLKRYLERTDQMDFWEQYLEAKQTIHPGVILSSFYAKLCYKSLVLGKNANLRGVRDIESNLKSTMDVGHGSVFEHVSWNFVTTGCSRVFTHELVRHRAGTAFSQTSGRYCAIDDSLEIVIPPELSEPEVQEIIDDVMRSIKDGATLLRQKLIVDAGVKDFATKKKITSAIRRIAPNGQTNEIGWSANVRSLRHMIEMRTSRHAEWEIRVVFQDVVNIIRELCPLMLYGGECELIDGLEEWTKLRV